MLNHRLQTARSGSGRALFTVALSIVMALVSALALSSAANASSHGLTFEFTQSELDNNWEADRQFPSGGLASVSAFGRDNVAQIGVDSANPDGDTFRRTEGIKTVGDNNFGETVSVDLYVDPDWQGKAVRAGHWVVGDDGTGARDNWYGIIEFVNLEPSSSGDSVKGDHEGWRFWDSANEWTNVNADFEYGEWHTLTIELDPPAEQYEFYVDDAHIGSGLGGENFIREVFLNSYNYGSDTFPNLSNDSYSAHWHGGLLNPVQKSECMRGGFATFGFDNQGRCIQFVNTGKDSR